MTADYKVKISCHVSQVGVTLPVYPLKGHLVTVRPAPGHEMITRNIYSPRHGLLSPLHPDGLRLSGIFMFEYKKSLLA